MWRKTKQILLILFLIQLGYIILLKWVFPPITIIQLSNWIEGYGLKRDYVSWDEISTEMKLAVIASEDQNFAIHSGFDWKSIQKAMDQKGKRKRVRGASTISQQVAKNVFLWGGRSWVRKGLEVYFTFMIETIWGKQRILEVYLNVIETGKGVFGVEAAARKYYKKSAKKLTRKEAAQIAGTLPNPKKYSVKPLSNYIIRRTPWITQQMNFIDGEPAIHELVYGVPVKSKSRKKSK